MTVNLDWCINWIEECLGVCNNTALGVSMMAVPETVRSTDLVNGSDMEGENLLEEVEDGLTRDPVRLTEEAHKTDNKIFS